MNRTPEHRDNPESDGAKPHTPDTIRNPSGIGKDKDQPETPTEAWPDPERDYPDAGQGVPR